MEREIPPGADPEPGTGTQYASVAKPPRNDDGLPCVARLYGHTFNVGHGYIDTYQMRVLSLKEVVMKSSWCSTGTPEENGYPILVWEAERGENPSSSIRTEEDADAAAQRYELRYTVPFNDPGAPVPPWAECDEPFEYPGD